MTAALLRTLQRRPERVLLLIGALCACAYAGAIAALPRPDGRLVVGDAAHYYVYLRSAVFDRDLQFQNDYMRLYGITHEEPDTDWIFNPLPSGYVRNYMPIGPAIVWAPLYLLTTAAVWLGGLLGAGYPLDGYGRLFQAAAGFSGIAAGTAGAWLAWRAAAVVAGARTALAATLGLWLGSSAIYYTLVAPAYSHAASMLATGWFVYLWVTRPPALGVRRYALLGAAGGFAALVRWQDAVFLAAPVLDALLDAHGRRGGRGWMRAAGYVAVCAAAALLVFLPQMLVWQTLYGSLLTVPQGAGFMQWTRPHLLDVLVSDRHGLFTWTPIVALAVAGFWPLARTHGRIAAGAAAVFGLSWYANAAVLDWWAGASFGLRRFVSCFPLFVVGLAALTRTWRPRVLWPVLGVFVALNGLLGFQYQLFMKGLQELSPYPRGFYDLWLARFVVPFRFLGRLTGWCC